MSRLWAELMGTVQSVAALAWRCVGRTLTGGEGEAFGRILRIPTAEGRDRGYRDCGWRDCAPLSCHPPRP